MGPRPIVKPRKTSEPSLPTEKTTSGYAMEMNAPESILLEGEKEEPISPLYAIKAFAIATAIVTGGATVLSVGTARILGIHNVRAPFGNLSERI